MPLDTYRAKRDFGRTPEPDADPPDSPVGQRDTAAPLLDPESPRFVVQKHAASRLHYDFRLEMEGVLRSWAVPKGPSMEVGEKRLAVEVEDHPLDYGDFEGVIPEGEYGGGTVMVWDRGRYMPRGDAAAMYRAGDMKFDLYGTKLKGGFALVRMKRRPKEVRDNWLLIKERDPHARQGAESDLLTLEPYSAKTGRSMEEIASGVPVSAEENGPDPSGVTGAVRAAAPEVVQPQLATKVDRPPAGERWLHEIKLDGYRVLARVDGDSVSFFTRTGADWTSRFSALVEPVRTLGLESAWLDGEVSVLRPDGRTSFGALQAELKRRGAADITYHVFDLIYLRGYDLRGAALLNRKRLLKQALAQAGPRVRFVDHVIGQGEAFFGQTCAYALEGSVAKRVDSVYRPGRGRDWQKSKCTGREDFVIVGYTVPAGAGDGIGALALASISPSGALAYAGRVGTGWSADESARMRARLDALASDGPALQVGTAESAGVRWVRPEVIAEVSFAGWTAGGLLRHASFEGVREDISPRRSEADRDSVAGVKLTHPDKVLFSGLGVTKRELADYYERVSEWMLPHLADRPLVLVRCPHGAGEACFYQKNAIGGFPASIGHVVVQHDEGPVSYALVDSAEGLVGLVQLGVIEIHTWGALSDDVERPNRLVIDLDPGPGVTWESVCDGARRVREVVEVLGATPFLKTTGGKGLHVVAPIERTASWTLVRDIAKAIAGAVAGQAPAAFTTNPLKRHRNGRIFVDYVRNTRGATAVSAFSARARGLAPVSVPIHWDELTGGVRSDGYDIRSVLERLKGGAEDPWASYSGAAVDPALLAAGLGITPGS